LHWQKQGRSATLSIRALFNFCGFKLRLRQCLLVVCHLRTGKIHYFYKEIGLSEKDVFHIDDNSNDATQSDKDWDTD